MKGLMLKLKLQHFGHLVQSPLIGKAPNTGKDWRQKEREAAEHEMVGAVSPTQWTWIWSNSSKQQRTEEAGVLQSMRSQRAGHNLVAEQQQVNLRIVGWESDTRMEKKLMQCADGQVLLVGKWGSIPPGTLKASELLCLRAKEAGVFTHQLPMSLVVDSAFRPVLKGVEHYPPAFR